MMDKVRAYIGLAAAAALAVVALYPIGATSRYPIRVTPLDRDIISAAIRSASDMPKLMDRAYGALYRCRGNKKNSYDMACGVDYIAPDIGYIYDHKDSLSKFVPDIDKRLNDFFDEYGKTRNADSPILKALKVDIVKHYDEIFAKYRTNYAITTFMVHAIILFLIGVMVWYRRTIGQAVETIVVAPFRLAGKALAGVHKRI